MKQFYFTLSLLFTTVLGFAQLTPPDDLQTYYNTVNFTKTGTELKADLSAVTENKHTKSLTYTEVWSALKVTDLDPTNSDNVLLIYGYDDTDGSTSTDRSRDKDSNGGSTGEWNREHIYAKSLGTPNLGTSGPGSDAQMLRPSDIGRNSDRGSLKFVDGSGTSTQTSGGWYPGDEWKGDCARIIMYMYIRYGDQCLPTNVGIGDSNDTPDDMIDLFLEWNIEDPVSDFEKQRNTYHANTSNTYAQGNRNPFIDNPYLATVIWGGDDAENLWNGNTSEADTEVPTIPTDLAYSNVTSSSTDLTWTASTDNVAVAAYNVYMDGAFLSKAYTNNITISDLTAEITYTFSISAEDASGNISATTATVSVTTTEEIVYDYCTSESFEKDLSKDGVSSSTYSDRTWTGDNGLEWSATDSRIDQTIDGTKTVCIRNGILTAPKTSNGIGALTVTTLRVYSGGSGTFDLVVNGNVVGEIPYSDEEQTTTIENINIEGDVSVIFNNKTTTSDRIIIDNLAWTCYNASLSIEDDALSNATIYPNPIKNELNIALPNGEATQVNIYNILGKLVISKTIKANTSIDTQNLQSGVYILRLTQSNATISKKLIKN